MTTAEEIAIRQKARQDYREDTFNNTYKRGTEESLIYTSEVQRIKFEEFTNDG